MSSSRPAEPSNKSNTSKAGVGIAAEHEPRPLSNLDARALSGVLTDIDDTLTTDGRLTADAFRALWELHEAGFKVVPVTGRSAGWAHMVMKTWPVDAVVAESGGLYLKRSGTSAGRGMERVLHTHAAQVRADRQALHDCALRIMAQVPGLREASDNAFRLVDYALDYCEEVERVEAAEVQRALEQFRAHGFSARASSVHINAWRGDFDKAPTAIRLLREVFSDCGGHALERWVFVGDAPNDASMFSAFPNTVAVANLRPQLDQLPDRPRFMTQASFGAGFVELARHLLDTRR